VTRAPIYGPDLLSPSSCHEIHRSHQRREGQLLQPLTLPQKWSRTRRSRLSGTRARKRPVIPPIFAPSDDFHLWSTEELDSYLYQTVGQDAIEFVARALDIPLYRRVISGTALVQDSEYGGRDARERGGVDGDETEDLYALLAHVKVMQTLSMHLFSSVKHVVCCSLNIPTQGVSLSVPYFRTTSAYASSMSVKGCP
jgi:hypothetical protein